MLIYVLWQLRFLARTHNWQDGVIKTLTALNYNFFFCGRILAGKTFWNYIKLLHYSPHTFPSPTDHCFHKSFHCISREADTSKVTLLAQDDCLASHSVRLWMESIAIMSAPGMLLLGGKWIQLLKRCPSYSQKGGLLLKLIVCLLFFFNQCIIEMVFFQGCTAGLMLITF